MMRTTLKKMHAIIQEGNAESALSVYKNTCKVLDQLAGKHLIHKNKVARHKSRFAQQIKAPATN